MTHILAKSSQGGAGAQRPRSPKFESRPRDIGGGGTLCTGGRSQAYRRHYVLRQEVMILHVEPFAFSKMSDLPGQTVSLFNIIGTFCTLYEVLIHNSYVIGTSVPYMNF